MWLRTTLNYRSRPPAAPHLPSLVHENPELWPKLRCLVSPDFPTINRLLFSDAYNLQPMLSMRDIRCLVVHGLGKIDQCLPALSRIDCSYLADEKDHSRALDKIQIFNVDHYLGFSHLNTESGMSSRLVVVEGMIDHGVRAAIAQRNLRELQLTIPVFKEKSDYLDRLAWLRSQRGIKVLTLVFSNHLFDEPNRYSINSKEVEMIARLVASLRDLETVDLRVLELSPELVGLFVEKLLTMSVAKITTIHQNCVQGMQLDRLRAFALGSFNVELKWGPRPTKFPVELDDTILN
jgi:hypothetical protein